MQKEFTIVVADDHPILLEGIVAVIKNEFPRAEITTVNNGADALQKIAHKSPDIAILDIEMPFLDGIEVVRKLRLTTNKTKIIILTLHKEKIFFNEIQDLDIYGYLLKEFSVDEITKCIIAVLNNEKFYSNSIDKYRANNQKKHPEFTKSEVNILKLIATGKTSKKIAEMLFVSVKTIHSHRYNICKKLQLKPENNSLIKWVYQNKNAY
ncbi:MAG: hypothetical protein COA67_09280 [Lutibacter sp.]|nr:MAG: hypothetical protein COA67_09280 [Lutibacter sp.]